jgi:hypothetical protein
MESLERNTLLGLPVVVITVVGISLVEKVPGVVVSASEGCVRHDEKLRDCVRCQLKQHGAGVMVRLEDWRQA